MTYLPGTRTSDQPLQRYVSLRSCSPMDLPVIDLKFLNHPFDRRIAIETVKAAIQIVQAKGYKEGVPTDAAPNFEQWTSTMLEFVRGNLGRGYHSMSMCRMGSEYDPMRGVDSRFRVVGVEGLRVADLSVCPVSKCNHTQINAYLIAERCVREFWKKRGVKGHVAETKV
ncbi:hypothetical protein K432DRAFT_290880 [Lepidopterella palustris CBS 459.81]|uniref:Glucose-methanol-choline oxidoreductase C-terminal domain-containing protein n=1 Tax=Lepidopterella palustris CBS 459.81 TaxID=1314670 RepID=A0A8E2EGE2_9PEZI|nr:hypothetical protein K432DRAFT_290880 [Lepidopterella palustris CBS 459.81]